jgi:diguanylate cyclase (GGDEF)-like protein
MLRLSPQTGWPTTGMLALSLALGVAVAAAIDTWSDTENPTATDVLTACAAALVIAAVMAVFGYVTRWRPFERAATAMPAPVPVQAASPWDHHESMPALLAAMETGILLLSAQDRVVYCNPAFLRIWRLSPQRDLTGTGLEELLAVMGSCLARPGERARFLLRAPPGNEAQIKLDLPMADGRLLTQQSHRVTDAQGAVLGRMWVFENVTVERRNARQLVQLAERDALTGQYNRHRFNEELARMMADAQRNGKRLGLLYLDLDGFKRVNDAFGHRAGDATLIHLANEVAGQVRRNEIFARLGGDEFAILVPDAGDDLLKFLAERVTRAIAQSRTEFEGQTLRVTCSCGIAVFPDNAATPDELTACADAALYQAKEAGRNTWRFYRAPADAAQPMPALLSPDARILHALENNLLELHYQGIYSTSQRLLRHYEVLLRVRDPDNADNTLHTTEFIAMAEKSGRILELDRWVLGQAIRHLAQDSTLPALAVNISGRSLDDAGLPGFIEQELARHGVPAQRLMVELTETAAVSDLHDARRFIAALQALGCGVSLDDFGTGFSSFAYLKHLDVDSIKIDGLFIRDLADDRENQLFVRAMVSVARGLHKTTIAECVEDEVALNLLAGLGVDYVQGFLLERPRAHPAASRTDVAHADTKVS